MTGEPRGDAQSVREALKFATRQATMDYNRAMVRGGVAALDRLVAALEAAELERDEARVNADKWSEVSEATHSAERAATRDAEARLVALQEALREIADRHPDAAPGEHPAVDIARAALAASAQPPARQDEAALSEPGGELPPAVTQVDRVPSHRSTELPCYFQIDRLDFAVDTFAMTGAQIRRVPNPSISDAYDLWKIGVGEDDYIVPDDDTPFNLRGARFFTSPKIINAGSLSAGGVAGEGDG